MQHQNEIIREIISSHIETKVFTKFIFWILTDPKYGAINQTKDKKSIEAIQTVIDLYKEWIDTGIKPSQELWRNAKELAWNAAVYASSSSAAATAAASAEAAAAAYAATAAWAAATATAAYAATAASAEAAAAFAAAKAAADAAFAAADAASDAANAGDAGDAGDAQLKYLKNLIDDESLFTWEDYNDINP